MLESNGTAVDAAITAMLCVGAVNPESSGIGGSGRRERERERILECSYFVSLVVGLWLCMTRQTSQSTPSTSVRWHRQPPRSTCSIPMPASPDWFVIRVSLTEHVHACTGDCLLPQGGLAVAVPGELAGMKLVYDHFGRYGIRGQESLFSHSLNSHELGIVSLTKQVEIPVSGYISFLLSVVGKAGCFGVMSVC